MGICECGLNCKKCLDCGGAQCECYCLDGSVDYYDDDDFDYDEEEDDLVF